MDGGAQLKAARYGPAPPRPATQSPVTLTTLSRAGLWPLRAVRDAEVVDGCSHLLKTSRITLLSAPSGSLLFYDYYCSASPSTGRASLIRRINDQLYFVPSTEIRPQHCLGLSSIHPWFFKGVLYSQCYGPRVTFNIVRATDSQVEKADMSDRLQSFPKSRKS